jgi:alpha-glucuronidase
MLKSAKNFALGFFGWPIDYQYQEVLTIEALGVRFTAHIYILIKGYSECVRSSTIHLHLITSKYVFVMSLHWMLMYPEAACPNAKNRKKSDWGTYYLKRWSNVYLRILEND